MELSSKNQTSEVEIQVNPDLLKERRSSTFYPEKLSSVLYGSSDNARRRRYIYNIVLTDSFYKDCKPWPYRDRQDAYETALKKSVHAEQQIHMLGLTDPDDKHYYRECAFPREINPFGLHFDAFMTTIESQGTDEQKQKWLPPAQRLQMIGTYGQTEMGHGTFLRGLETAATYDPKTKEFILNSPKLTSMKYWPGNLGKTVNHCIIMAQLYTNGKRYGMHSFVVQLRSMKDHSTLPGIELGDIGNKMGYNGIDNGYLRFTNYRIPRDNMLMRYSKVLENGTYVAPENTKLTYGSMVKLRSGLVLRSADCLAMACVISVRYSAVRRQTEKNSGGEELQIFDYQTQQYKLFPLVATAYAMRFTGRQMSNIYLDISKEITQGNLDSLSELHALSAGLKAFSSWTCSAGIEVCRLACGGHGYSQASGLPKIYSTIAPACTYDGENTVLMLQTARFLMKCVGQVREGKVLPGSVAYLNNKTNMKSSLDHKMTLESLLEAYEYRAARLVREAEMACRSMRKSRPEEVSRNLSSVQQLKAAKAHCHLYVFSTFIKSTNSVADLRCREALTSLCKLYGIHGIIENMGDFVQESYLTTDQVELVHNSLESFLLDIRSNAVAFVDAFDYPDAILGSCLGRYDGQVYQALYEYAKLSPLNNTDVHSSYHKYLQPLMGGAVPGVTSRL